ncbi:cyclic nucleotide-binding/CBS domain-containing protein [Haloplanus litoreus]|uniref:Cyclic nucleotide-binding/CBS domain-containing protein n=1 Tax=Haloplanus litoreus TaxID=767515 RepID=A0ABD5ZTX7_9EURY
MEDVFVGSLMSAPVHSVNRDASLREAARVLTEYDVGSVVVVGEADRLDGLLTVTDFVRVVAGDDGYGPGASVSAAMSTDLVTTGANEAITTAADLMVETGHYHLPVVDGEAVIGIVTAADLAAYVSTVRAPHPPRRG